MQRNVFSTILILCTITLAHSEKLEEGLIEEGDVLLLNKTIKISAKEEDHSSINHTEFFEFQAIITHFTIQDSNPGKNNTKLQILYGGLGTNEIELSAFFLEKNETYIHVEIWGYLYIQFKVTRKVSIGNKAKYYTILKVDHINTFKNSDTMMYTTYEQAIDYNFKNIITQIDITNEDPGNDLMVSLTSGRLFDTKVQLLFLCERCKGLRLEVTIWGDYRKFIKMEEGPVVFGNSDQKGPYAEGMISKNLSMESGDFVGGIHSKYFDFYGCKITQIEVKKAFEDTNLHVGISYGGLHFDHVELVVSFNQRRVIKYYVRIWGCPEITWGSEFY